MSIAHIIWPAARSILSAVTPNLLILLVIAANFTWWSRLLPIHYIGVPYMSLQQVWLGSLLTIGAVLVIDFTAISLFARRWRARRWGRKPPEIERATRYFIH